MPNIYCILTFFQVARQCFVITTCKITYCLVFREILHCLFDPSAVMYQLKIAIFRTEKRPCFTTEPIMTMDISDIFLELYFPLVGCVCFEIKMLLFDVLFSLRLPPKTGLQES